MVLAPHAAGVGVRMNEHPVAERRFPPLDGQLEVGAIAPGGNGIDDSFGIPHVRYKVGFKRPYIDFFDGGTRVLALKSFAERYPERSTG